MTRRALLLLVAALAAPRGGDATAQTEAGTLDLASLPIPEGMFELSDLAIFNSSTGGVAATATTTVLNSPATVLFSLGRTEGGQRGFIFALQPRAWSFNTAMPALASPVLDGLPISNVGLVITNQDVALHSSELSDDEWAFYREIYKADEFELRLTPGINFIAAFPSQDLPADSPLQTVMDALGIEEGVILLQGTLGKSLTLLTRPGAGGLDVIKDLYLRAELPPMRPPGSPEWFNSGQLALEITGQPSFRLVGELSVNIQEDQLMFFVAATLARSGMTLTGGLQADEDGWAAPFGIGWLTLNRVVLLLGVTATGSIQLGFAGDAVFGEKDIAVAIALAISPAGVPTNFMIEGESEAGIALSDVAAVQQRIARAAGRDEPRLPIDALPDVAITNLLLRFAPKAQLELGIEQGMALKGRLWLQTSPGGELTNFAGVDVNVSEDGFWMRGDVGAFRLGPLALEETVIDVTATRAAQYFRLKGGVDLLGARQRLDIELSRTGFSFRSETQLWRLFQAIIEARAAFSLRNPSFLVHAELQNDFADVIGPFIASGLQTFAEFGQDLLASTGQLLEAADRILADREADVESIRQALIALRAQANAVWAEARAWAEQARRNAAATRAAADAAYRSYAATSHWYPALKVQWHARWLVLEAQWRIQIGVANGLIALADVRQRIVEVLPPIEDNILLRGAEAALAIARDRVQTMRSNLAVLEQRYARVVDAIGQGITLPLTIERASFDANLADLTTGLAVRWSIAGTFLGRPFAIERSFDFSNLASATADLLKGLIG